MREPGFLLLSEVIEIHRDQIERYGGEDGLRDGKLLLSAVAMPESGAGGEYFHSDLFDSCRDDSCGDCDDNAPMERLFGTPKQALSHQEDSADQASARQSIFEYIEMFCNAEEGIRH